jgi:hypothetical protein
MFYRTLWSLLLLSGVVFQDSERKDLPVTWVATVERVSPHDFMLRLDATLAPGWYIYAQTTKKSRGGPATRIAFDSEGEFIPVGTASESGDDLSYYDDVYEMILTRYADHVSFEQRILVPFPDIVVRATVHYVACNGHVCMPAEKTFNFHIKPE